MSEIEEAVDAEDVLAPLIEAIAATLPSGWKLETLGSLCEKSQYGWTTKADKDGQGVKFLRTTDITPGVVDWERVPYCVEAPSDLDKYLIREGDLLISRTGSIGVNYLVSNPEPAVFASYLIRFRPKKSISTNYLRYFLQSPTYWRAIAAGKKGIAVQNVNATMLSKIPVPVAPDSEQLEIVAEIEKQFSRLDEAVANLQRVKANLKRYEKATIESLTNPETFEECVSGTIADVAISLDNMRKPVNKAERATRPGNVPYLGANGQTGWIDAHLFDEEIVLVVEDETFVGRTAPFSYYFAEKCWVNNHTHVLRARPDVVSPKYLNLALSYYPFIPLTTGSTGRRKLTKGALMVAPIVVPSLVQQEQIVSEVERRLSLTSEVLAEVGKNLQRSEKLRQAVLATAFGIQLAQPEH